MLIAPLDPSFATPAGAVRPYLDLERGDGHVFGGDAEQHDARQSRYDHQPGGKELTPRHEALFVRKSKRKQRSSERKLTSDSSCFLRALKRGERRGQGQALASAQPQATGTMRSAWARLRRAGQSTRLPAMHTVSATTASCDSGARLAEASPEPRNRPGQRC